MRNSVLKPSPFDFTTLVGIVHVAITAESPIFAEKIHSIRWQWAHNFRIPEVFAGGMDINFSQNFLNNGFFHIHMLCHKDLHSQNRANTEKYNGRTRGRRGKIYSALPKRAFPSDEKK